MQPLAGRLAARVSAIGRLEFTLRYQPRSFVVGRAVSLVSLPLSLLVFAWGVRRRRLDRSRAASG